MRVSSYTRYCLEEEVVFCLFVLFSDKILELITKPRQEVDTLLDKNSLSYL